MTMTIYVADDLKRRMDKLEGVNWSALACAAFKNLVNSREREKEGANMDRVIERLRLSQQQEASSDEQAGRRAGRNWACNDATAAELQRLADEFERRGGDFGFGVGESAYTAAESLYFIIEPNGDGNRGQAGDFWLTILGPGSLKQLTSNDFLKGFAEAAVALWGEVRSKL